MVPRWARVQCSIVRLARGRESLGGQRMADILILPPSGCGTLGNQVSLGSILKVVPTSDGRHGGQPS